MKTNLVMLVVAAFVAAACHSEPKPPEVEAKACAAHGGVQTTVGPHLASDGNWYAVVGCHDGTTEQGSAPTRAGPWNHWIQS